MAWLTVSRLTYSDHSQQQHEMCMPRNAHKPNCGRALLPTTKCASTVGFTASTRRASVIGLSQVACDTSTRHTLHEPVCELIIFSHLRISVNVCGFLDNNFEHLAISGRWCSRPRESPCSKLRVVGCASFDKVRPWSCAMAQIAGRQVEEV